MILSPWDVFAFSDFVPRIFAYVEENNLRDFVVETALTIREAIAELGAERKWSYGVLMAALVLVLLELYSEALDKLPDNNAEKILLKNILATADTLPLQGGESYGR